MDHQLLKGLQEYLLVHTGMLYPDKIEEKSASIEFREEESVLYSVAPPDNIEDGSFESLENLECLENYDGGERLEDLESIEDLESLEKLERSDNLESLDKIRKPKSIEPSYFIQKQMMFSMPPQTEADNRSLSSNYIKEEDLKKFIRKVKNEETFSTKLLKYIDQTGLMDSVIYKKAGLDRRHFSKIRCDKDYRPKKATAMALCLALELSMEQVEEMLGLAGYSLAYNDVGDLIVRYCIEKRIYDLMNVNNALEYFGMKVLGAVGE